MVLELAEIDVLAGREEEFADAAARAAPHFRAAAGCRSLRLARSVERPGRFRLMVEWDTVDDHMVAFRQSDGFTAWRALASPFFDGTPRVEHVHTVLDAL